MKKLVFTATLFITIILIPFLAFPDGDKHKETIKSSALTKASAIPSEVYINPQNGTEADREYNDHTEMEFRVCG